MKIASELNAKKCGEKTAEIYLKLPNFRKWKFKKVPNWTQKSVEKKLPKFIWNCWTSENGNFRILRNWTQKSVEKKLLKLNHFLSNRTQKIALKNKNSVPIRSTARQQLLQAIWVLVLNLKFVLCQENLVNPKVLANLVPNCF